MSEKVKMNPRELMQLAIEVMRMSVDEPRRDNKKCPSVGAVLLKPDGTVETACRGELRHGDHADFTLLDRKNRTSKLDGSILFTTLEPCAPGSRRHPKIDCAERIVLARISEVWIGIEDPDPTVDRKGIRFLEENDITVHMFDRDLQKVILEENEQFFRQALSRAEIDTKTKVVSLSTLEPSIKTSTLDNLSIDALGQFRTKVGIEDKIGSEPFNNILLQQGLMHKTDNKFIPNGFGILLFGENPRTFFPHAGLLGTIRYPTGEPEIEEFNYPLVLIPDLVGEWLKKALPLTIDRNRIDRTETPSFPPVLVREAIVNALVHRDYDIAGAKCHLVISENTIMVKSPGYPVSPIKLEDLQTFNAPALSRNPVIHFTFAQMKMAEERGFGMETWRSLPDKFGLPLPKYSFEDPYLVLTLYRNEKGVEQDLGPELFEALNADERTGWLFLVTKTETTTREYANRMQFDNRKAQRHFKRYVELGLLERVGAGPATKYIVLRP
jgi:ATP-dependent DNA helicase RecG